MRDTNYIKRHSIILFKLGNAVTSTTSTESVKTVCIKQTIAELNCTYALSCKHDDEATVSCCTQFDPNGNGQNLWTELNKNGKLTELVLDNELKGKKNFRTSIINFNCNL